MTIQKRRIWYCFWIRCKSWQKSVSEKFCKQESDRKKSFLLLILCAKFRLYFFWVNFFALFSTDSNSALILLFMFFMLTLKQKSETAQKQTKNVFYSVSSQPCFTSVCEDPFCQKKSKSLYPSSMTLLDMDPEADKPSEPVLLNVYGATALIPRNEFRQPM